MLFEIIYIPLKYCIGIRNSYIYPSKYYNGIQNNYLKPNNINWSELNNKKKMISDILFIDIIYII